MPKYLFRGSYGAEAVKGLLKEGGTSRKATIEQLVKGAGGSVESFYYTFGDDDVIVIVDLPDEETATAIALTIAASGAVRLKTTVLITPETVDAAAKKSIAYRPPGG